MISKEGLCGLSLQPVVQVPWRYRAIARNAGASKGAFDLGITFDGDADRALFCDAHGNVVNGDGVLLLAARDMQAKGSLRGDTVVATTM